MIPIVYEDPFNGGVYAMKSLSKQRYVGQRGSLKSKPQQSYFFQTYQLDGIPQRIHKRVLKQIQHYYSSQQQPQIKSLYIYESRGFKHYTLQYRYSKYMKGLHQLDNYPTQKSLICCMKSIAMFVHSMHQKKIVHNNIYSKNIYRRKKDKFIVGPPYFAQICKYAKRNDDWDGAGERAGYYFDVYQLGFVFIQLVVKRLQQQNQQTLRKLVKTIKNKLIRLLCLQMIEQDQQIRLKLDQTLQVLESIEKEKVDAFTQTANQYYQLIRIPLFNNQELYYKDYRTLNRVQINPYFQLKESILVVNSQEIKGISVEMDTVNVSKEQRQRLKKLHQSSSKSIANLTGSISIYYKKQMILNKQFQGRICTIKSRNKFSKGIFLDSQILICPLNSIYDKEQNRQIDELQVKASLGMKFNKLKLCYNENNFGLIDIITRVQDFSRTYVRFIKNYDQEIMDQLIFKEKQDIYYNYQISQYGFAKSALILQKNQFRIKESGLDILAGEPLRINFSNGNEGVIGIYEGNGRGMLFDDVFYWSLFHSLVDLHREQPLVKIQLSLIVVDCRQFWFQKQQIININQWCYDIYKAQHRIKTYSDLQKRVELLKAKQCGSNTAEIAFLTFHLRTKYLKIMDQKSVVRLCLQSAKLFDSVYKVPVCSGVVYFICTYQLFPRLKDQPQNAELRSQLYSLIMKLIELLQQNNWNPILLLGSYYQAAICIRDYSRSIIHHQQSIDLCIRLNNLAYLYLNYLTIMKEYKLDEQQMQKHFRQYENNRYQQTKDDSAQAQFQRAIHRLKLFRQAKIFTMINKSLLLLFQIQQRFVVQDEQEAKRLRQLWKSIIVDVMKEDVSLGVLYEFERITQTYFEEGYAHTKDHFRQKQKMIKGKANPNNRRPNH